MVERFVEEGAIVFFSGRRAGLGTQVAQATGAQFMEADVVLGAVLGGVSGKLCTTQI